MPMFPTTCTIGTTFHLIPLAAYNHEALYCTLYVWYILVFVDLVLFFNPAHLDKPAKGVVFVADPEPKHSLQQEKEMNVHISAIVEYSKYECSATSPLKFVDTYIFQTKTHRYIHVGSCQVYQTT